VQLPLVSGLAGHNFLVLVDPDWKVVGELHGQAADPRGDPKPIGNMPQDRLKPFEYPEAHFYRRDYAQVELASGDQAAIMNLWNAGRAAGAKMKELDIQYPWMWDIHRGYPHDRSGDGRTFLYYSGQGHPSGFEKRCFGFRIRSISRCARRCDRSPLLQ
jgi:hypothetical protein